MEYPSGLSVASPPPQSFLRIALVALYACATLQFIRFYTVSTTFYLSLPAYLAGHERLPFQERILPAVIINLFQRLPAIPVLAPHAQGAYTSDRGPIYILALISMVIAAYFTQRLYRAVSPHGTLWFLVYPIFLIAMLWAYTMHLEANYAYPYDIPSVAFFSAGLYFIYVKRFLPLLFVVLIGTFNRETTLFLIVIFFIDSLSRPSLAWDLSLRDRFSFRVFPWAKALPLIATWLAIKLILMHIFAHNSHAEDYVRIRENFGRLKPRLWPALLNICGYMLPMVLLFHRDIKPQRFQNYLWVVPLWLGIMFYTGVILETRIYGELCPYVAVAIVLIMEQQVARPRPAPSVSVLRP